MNATSFTIPSRVEEAQLYQLDPILAQSLAALGLPQIAPEPEVTAASLARVRAKTLASFIAALLNDNEPLLRAEHDGATVQVREIGSDAVMSFTIETRELRKRGERK